MVLPGIPLLFYSRDNSMQVLIDFVDQQHHLTNRRQQSVGSYLALRPRGQRPVYALLFSMDAYQVTSALNSHQNPQTDQTDTSPHQPDTATHSSPSPP